ncbi:hypothetical protein [Nesterenkonia suensis]
MPITEDQRLQLRQLHHEDVIHTSSLEKARQAALFDGRITGWSDTPEAHHIAGLARESRRRFYALVDQLAKEAP